MLLKIRQKSQGVFSWIILILICVPFALWGIQNYVGGGSETAIASVGDREFFQNDVNRAYSQFSQNLAGMNFDEATVKKQALEKLIQDEVLLQHVVNEGLLATDDTAKQFINTLEYFQTDGKFDQSKYKSLLGGQRISSAEFVGRIKKALVMEQFQRSVTDSSFATQTDLDNFFRIQNQKRDAEIITVALQTVEQEPTEQEIETYYQQNSNQFLTDEQVAIEYVELSLNELAKQVEPTAEQLQNYYEDQKDLYTIKERRKISHILFAFTKDTESDEKQLQRALQAQQDLATNSFADLATEVSDDKGTAVKGGDLGLFNLGEMEAAFEEAASALKLGEVSKPVKSAFGYHLIKVTELKEGGLQPFETVKVKVMSDFQKADAENTYFELVETMTELSYENPESLDVVSDQLGLEIKKSPLFGKVLNPDFTNQTQENIITQPTIINAAFSEDILKGNNSEPIELGEEKHIVLRMSEHRPAEVKALTNVKTTIITALNKEKAKQLTAKKAEEIKVAVLAGKDMATVASEKGLTVQSYKQLARSAGDVSWLVNQAIFKAAKPLEGKTTIAIVAEPTGAQTIVSVTAVTEGVMTDSDKEKLDLAKANIAKAFGEAEFAATINSLRTNADVRINLPE